MNCCLAQSKPIHLKIRIVVNIKMLVRFTANVGFIATMLRRVSKCIKYFACKVHRRLLLKNKNAAYVAKPVVGVLRRSSKPLQSKLLLKRHPPPLIKIKSQQPKPLAGFAILSLRARFRWYNQWSADNV